MAKKYAHLDADGFVLGFYDEEWHRDSIPADAVAIDDAHHAALLEGQAAGKRMKVSSDGSPILVDRPAPTDDELAVALRDRREVALRETDWLVTRHTDETILKRKPTLSEDQINLLLGYRQALRDLPVEKGFPRVDLPAAPDFMGVK